MTDTVAAKSESEFQRECDLMVERDIYLCVSSIVSTLESGYGNIGQNRPDKGLAELTEQASELCYPIQDFESAAIEAGWTRVAHNGMFNGPIGSDIKLADYSDWQELCEDNAIEPHDREVFEHWAVSTWLAEKLAAKGERVDTDFAGWNVWARTTTGQAISMDHVIREIRRDLSREVAAMREPADA